MAMIGQARLPGGAHLHPRQPQLVKLPALCVPPRRGTLQIVSGLRSNKDPWNVLGVKPGATEHEIKQAHRHLVKQHHPDVKQGDVMAHAKFLSIQEAYEFLTGKSRGKELDSGPGARGGWDFHDWYWKFSMRRRKGTTASGQAPPPPPTEDTLRDNWKQQLSGLRHKAAAKKAGQGTKRGYRGAHAADQDPSSAASSSVWRSATKSQSRPPPAHQHPAPPQASSIDATGDAGASTEPLQTQEEQQHRTSSAVSPEDEGLSDDAWESGAHTANEGEPSVLSDTVTAVRAMQSRHHEAVRTHVQKAVSQIVKFTARLKSKLNVEQAAGAAGQRPAMGGVPLDLHVEFQDVVRMMMSGSSRMAGARDAAINNTSSSSSNKESDQEGSEYAPYGPIDHHARKFADRSYVEERLSTQLAGLKRRAAIKDDL